MFDRTAALPLVVLKVDVLDFYHFPSGRLGPSDRKLALGTSSPLHILVRMERGPGNWPVDPKAAFVECRQKLDKARKEAEHWRDNHKTLRAEAEKLRSENDMLKAGIERTSAKDRILSVPLMEELAERLARCPEIAAESGGDWNEAGTLAHALSDIETSCEVYLEKLLPALARSDLDGEPLVDMLQETAMELRHVMYHSGDSRFLRRLTLG